MSLGSPGSGPRERDGVLRRYRESSAGPLRGRECGWYRGRRSLSSPTGTKGFLSYLRPCGPRLLFASFFVEECFVPPLRGGGGLLFARAKRSKRSLRKLCFLRTFLNYGGYCFLRFHCNLSGLNRAAPMYRAKRLSDDVVGRPYRHTRWISRGASVRRPPLADSIPLTGRQAELVNRQAPRLDTRRIRNSEASPVNQTRRTAL